MAEMGATTAVPASFLWCFGNGFGGVLGIHFLALRAVLGECSAAIRYDIFCKQNHDEETYIAQKQNEEIK